MSATTVDEPPDADQRLVSIARYFDRQARRTKRSREALHGGSLYGLSLITWADALQWAAKRIRELAEIEPEQLAEVLADSKVISTEAELAACSPGTVLTTGGGALVRVTEDGKSLEVMMLQGHVVPSTYLKVAGPLAVIHDGRRTVWEMP
ncbi:MAG TPA: hypothetical protein VK735_39805 [Pseudonocardia sp.]|uniref:hypothetical protein n=1 Tax=Pseudonocardia sp. TaxID=60912 RepID=UPI002BD9B427|nr:hypothetical protein [Pseudonocardia sp.]HTF53629.1 hypothetical protein [Pseudonocardia sp.]